MRIAMAQLCITASIEQNLQKTLEYMERAKAAGADLIFFPEIQLSPFFPQHEKRDASQWLMTLDHPAVLQMREACRRWKIWASPNIYLELDGKQYDASLMIDSNGEMIGVSKMVHVTQTKQFYEQDYYTPSDDGFHVYDTPFGKIGIVICFDRHLPDDFRSCALQGADLILIPTANICGEPLELFEWEVRVQAFQNTVFAAMCNRVGTEDDMRFAGQSILAAPNGNMIAKLSDEEALFVADIPMEQAIQEQKQRPWLTL